MVYMRQYISVKHSPVFDFKSPSSWDFSTLCFLKARPFAAQSSFSKLIANFDRLPCCKENGLSMTLCRPARDTLLSNRDKETLNLDTNYITTSDKLVEKMIYVPFCHNQL